MLNGRTTYSPTFTLSTPSPTSTTWPRFSWPNQRPGSKSVRPSYMCRSEPQRHRHRWLSAATTDPSGPTGGPASADMPIPGRLRRLEPEIGPSTDGASEPARRPPRCATRRPRPASGPGKGEPPPAHRGAALGVLGEHSQHVNTKVRE